MSRFELFENVEREYDVWIIASAFGALKKKTGTSVHNLDDIICYIYHNFIYFYVLLNNIFHISISFSIRLLGDYLRDRRSIKMHLILLSYFAMFK